MSLPLRARARGSGWTTSPRNKPYFSVQNDGLDVLYNQEHHTLDESVCTSGRSYASSFHTTVQRMSHPRPLYDSDSAPPASSAIRVREPWRASCAFAPRVGGKFAHVGVGWW